MIFIDTVVLVVNYTAIQWVGKHYMSNGSEYVEYASKKMTHIWGNHFHYYVASPLQKKLQKTQNVTSDDS